MEGAFSWIQHCAEWFARWVPKWDVLCSNQAMLKFVCGRPRVLKGPCIAWWWPICTVVYTYWTNEQVVTLSKQDVMTDDGKTIAVRAVLSFVIEDVAKFGVNVLEGEESVAEAAGAAVCHVVQESSLARLCAGRADLHKALLREAQRATERFGVRILSIRFSSLAPARVISLLSAGVEDRAQGGRLLA